MTPHAEGHTDGGRQTFRPTTELVAEDQFGYLVDGQVIARYSSNLRNVAATRRRRESERYVDADSDGPWLDGPILHHPGVESPTPPAPALVEVGDSPASIRFSPQGIDGQATRE